MLGGIVPVNWLLAISKYVNWFKELNIDAGMVPVNLTLLRDKRCKLGKEPNAVGMGDADCHQLFHLLLLLPWSKATTDFDRVSHERNGHVHHTGIPELFAIDAAGKALIGQIVLRGQRGAE